MISNTTAQGVSRAPLDEMSKKSRVATAAWTAGLSAYFVMAVMNDTLNWPEAFVLCCVIGMVGFVCYLILNYR